MAPTKIRTQQKKKPLALSISRRKFMADHKKVRLIFLTARVEIRYEGTIMIKTAIATAATAAVELWFAQPERWKWE
jgi:hypothetical protein